MFALEGLGILLTFSHIIDTSPESGLTFIPLNPPQETTLYLIWNRYQAFTPMGERFKEQILKTFEINA
jgi:DNA-binding transcriptional LysR family regulator